MAFFLHTIGSLLVSKVLASAPPGINAGGTAPSASYSNAFDDYCTVLHSDCGAGAAFPALFAMRAAHFFLILIGSVAVLAIIYGGFKIITSAGNDQGAEEAKQIITAAAIGLVLAVAAESIIWYIARFVT